MPGNLKNSAERSALYFWCALPVAGNLTAPFFLILTPFCRNNGGAARPDLLAFTALCVIYVGYIAATSFAMGPVQSAFEPIGDAASLLLCTGLLTWALRGNTPLLPVRLYRLVSLMLLAVFVLALIEYMFRDQPPTLLLQNQLNLAPMLLAPAMLCTMFDMAPSRRAAILGWLGFVCALLTIGMLAQTRGPMLVMGALVILRLGFLACDPAPRRTRATYGSAVLVGLVLGLMPVVLNESAMARFHIGWADAVVDPVAEQNREAKLAIEAGATERIDAGTPVKLPRTTDQSMNERLAMLRAGWYAFLDQPLWGHGPQNRFEAAVPYLPPDFEMRYSHLHNDFITHAVAGGVPAVVLLCALLSVPLVAAVRHPGPKRRRKIEVGLLFTAAFTGTAAVNNVLFVDISAFSLGLSYVIALLLIEAV